MELIGIKLDEGGQLKLHEGEVKLFGFNSFTDNHPEIILTKDEIETRGLSHLIPEKLGLRDKILNRGRKAIAFCRVGNRRVPITLKED